MGDTPYSPAEESLFLAMMQRIDQEDVAFVVHVGDFKSGDGVCSDRVFQQRREWFDQSRHPFIYVPGDNDWTDCHRKPSGAYAPLERLAKLRALFFPDDESLGRTRLRLARQSENLKFASYRENVRWTVGPVLFVALNIPGSNNNLGRAPDADAEYRQRGEVNLAWLQESFALAKRRDDAAVVVFFQANPGFEIALNPDRQNGYRAFIEQFSRAAQAFGKPVLVAHGDTHSYRVDKPLKDPFTEKEVTNVTRVETFGSPFVNWVRVTVTPDNPTPFKFEVGKPKSEAARTLEQR